MHAHNRRTFPLRERRGGEGAGSGGPDPDAVPEDQTVGVALPTQTYERWVADGNNIKEGMESLGARASPSTCSTPVTTSPKNVSLLILDEPTAIADAAAVMGCQSPCPRAARPRTGWG